MNRTNYLSTLAMVGNLTIIGLTFYVIFWKEASAWWILFPMVFNFYVGKREN